MIYRRDVTPTCTVSEKMLGSAARPERLLCMGISSEGNGSRYHTAAHWICQVFGNYLGEGTAGLHIAASTNHGTHSLHKLSQLGRRERAGRPQDDRLMNGDESVGKSHARPIDAAA